MATKAYALTTRQRLKDFIKLSADDDVTNRVLDRIIDSVTEFIENYIGFRVQQTTYTEEEIDSDFGDSINLKNFPIVSFSKLERRNSSLNEDDWETIDSKYYDVDLKAGILFATGGSKFPQTRRGFRVTYVAGYNFDNASTFLSDTEGGDLEWAAWILGSTAWQVRGGGVSSERIGDYSVSFRQKVMESDELKDILDKYASIDAGASPTPFHF